MYQSKAEALADASAFSFDSDQRSPKRFLLNATALILLLIALSQPRWGYEGRATSGPPETLWLIFDVGTTMRCRDLPVSRGEFAKAVADSLIEKWNGRIRISTFDDCAELVSPATTDSKRSRRSIDRIAFDSSSKSNLRAVIDHAANESMNDGFLGVVLSDGGGTTVAPPVDSTKINGDWIVVGLGDPANATPIPSPEGGWLLERGAQASSKRNDASLETLTRSFRGRFLPAWPNAEAVAHRILLEGRSIRTVVRGSELIPQEQFQWFAAAALFLLLRPWSWRIRPMTTIATFFLAAGLANAQERIAEYRSARLKLEAGRFAEARTEFETLIQQGKEIGWSHWGSGVAAASQAMAGENLAKRRELFAEAVSSFRRAAETVADPSERAAVLSNLGVVKRSLTEANPDRSAESGKNKEESSNDSSNNKGSQTSVADANPNVEKKSGTEIGGGSVERPVAGLNIPDPGPLPKAKAAAMLDAVVQKAELAAPNRRPTRPKQ